MASERKPYYLRLELRDSSGRVVGEITAYVSGEALRSILETPSRAAQGSSGIAERRPKPFRGRDEHPTAARGDERGMSSEQRKFLFRLAYSLGLSKESATKKVLQALGVDDMNDATRSMASRGIDALKEEVAHKKDRSNGVSHAH